ncbi:MAG: hypothetical protein HFK00_07915 [Oscillospiraceae bacterium]|nr:hypothetical protein [Oscillospiraceae bacterium]
MQQNNNGLYIYLEGNTIHRYILNESVLEQIEDTTIEDELISTLEIIASTYEMMVEYVEGLTELPDGEHYGEIYKDQVETVINKALETAEEIKVNDIIMGQLLKASVLNAAFESDNGTAMNWLNLMNDVVYAMKEPLYFRAEMYHILKENSEYDNLDKWFEECVFTDDDLFSRSYKLKYAKKDLKGLKPELIKMYFFQSYAAYYSFLIINFAQMKKKVRICQCCGKFFIPKTKRITLYCDRVITSNGNTCKQVAPKLMQKYLKSKDAILDDYERAKNRNYKRVERFENKLSNKPAGRDLTFSQYNSWMHKMSSAKTMYLQGKLNSEGFSALIHELD